MLQIANDTPFQVKMAVFADPEGIECVYAAVKATFTLPPKDVALADKQAPVVLVDEYRGDPASSSLKYAGDMTLQKPATDVVLLGHAYAPEGQAPTSLVTLQVGELKKSVQVFGDRVWKPGFFGHKMTKPEPFEKMPLVYERAFGGSDPEPRDPNKVDNEPRNPIGRGLVPKNSRLPAKGIALPNLEDPAHLIRRAGDRPAPACFAFTCGHWEPRRQLAGTYDEAWTKTRAPYLPLDFDPRFFQSAAPELIAPEFLTGGEPVEIVGAAPAGPLRFALPVCTVEMIFHLDGKESRAEPRLDTVVFEPDEGRFTMLWRARQAVDKKLMRLSQLVIACREYPKRKAA